ncbi:MAG TPA: TIM barrel protein [Pseudolysinimonas sp.]|nr:TIM barrel protein [Pseudolysinimonas sp.]
MTMLLGIGSYTLPWAIGVAPEIPASPLDHAGLLAAATELGAEVVQFADNLPVHELDDGTLGTLRDDADRRGIRVEIGVRGVAADTLTKAAAAATRLGAPFVRTILEAPGAGHLEVSAAVAALAPLELEFRDRGLRLAIENHDRHRTDELLGVIDALGDWSGVCLDTVNSFGALEDPDRVIAVLAPVTIAVHVKDFSIHRQWHKMGFEIVGAPVGQGRLDLATLFEAVGDRAESAVVELWTPFQGDLASTIRLEHTWATQSMVALRAVTRGDDPSPWEAGGFDG